MAAHDLPNREDESDDVLMQAIAGGSRDAFDVLVRRHYPRLCAVAARYLRSRTLARDVTHDTLLDILQGAKRYEPRGRFRSYAYRILLNHCHGAHRRARYSDQLRKRLDSESPVANDAIDLIERDEQRRRITEAAETLGQKLRDVVYLRFTADLSCPEIAETLQLPVGTVQSRLFNALKKLRDVLE